MIIWDIPGPQLDSGFTRSGDSPHGTVAWVEPQEGKKEQPKVGGQGDELLGMFGEWRLGRKCRGSQRAPIPHQTARQRWALAALSGWASLAHKWLLYLRKKRSCEITMLCGSPSRPA